ncbi:polyserase-2 [Trichonephila inaurata madagascariensis]|uniref:Polyserase-2 n=1 Tax=Trichonephila inaurata madagascariensis TaxID=2747483 RepID=A0A8X7CAH3_9ARAC|nr:polyserase-2 [Trichonephila inaurata madagascariensis]
MKGNPVIYSILIYIFLPVTFTFELRNGNWIGLNENHTFENEMNRASSSSQNCLCGRENVEETKRIVGGSTVNPPHRFPWMVAVVRRIYNVDDFYCGGALISPYYVLTAAHCLTSQTIRNTRVALGAHDSTSSPESVPISLLLAHPQYREDSLLNDIGLVKLRTPAQLGPYVNVLCLPASAVARPDEMATAVGWGMHKDPGGVPFEELQEVDLRILSLDACFVIHFPDFDNKTQICAGGQGRSPCAGDSGGPLFVKQGSKWYGVGVVAGGRGCGALPGIFTRVIKYLPWIERETGDSPPCILEPLKVGELPPVTPNLNDCGIPNEMEIERIAGGSETTPFELPWMAIIEYNDFFLGSGSLISPNFVLTAASIFKDWMLRDLHKISVILGQHEINPVSDNHEKRFDVMNIYIHSRYNSPTIHSNDLALIQLKEPVESQYRPICLPQRKDEYFPNTDLTIAGWGSTRLRSPLSSSLRKAE